MLFFLALLQHFYPKFGEMWNLCCMSINQMGQDLKRKSTVREETTGPVIEEADF